MMSGSPPTERKARTGLFTPPTRTFSAFSNISRERWRSGKERLCVALMCAPWRSGFQPASRILGVVGEDYIRTGPLNARKNFQDHALFVDPAIARRRLDHDDVGAFLDVQRDFFQRFACIGGVHLVAAAIAELRRGLRGFAERAVET